MKKVNKQVESVVKKVVNHMVDSELYSWPPQCASFLYQPYPRTNMEDKRRRLPSSIVFPLFVIMI